MNSKVTVEANQQGDVITKSPKKANWGWIRVTQTRAILDEETGIIKTIFCSALVQGWINDLTALNWKDGQQLEGKIIFKDSMTPFRSKNSEADIKIAGRTGVACTLNGEPIYRKYFYSANPDAQDVLIKPDRSCQDDIRDAYTALDGEGLEPAGDSIPELTFDL